MSFMYVTGHLIKVYSYNMLCLNKIISASVSDAVSEKLSLGNALKRRLLNPSLDNALYLIDHEFEIRDSRESSCWKEATALAKDTLSLPGGQLYSYPLTLLMGSLYFYMGHCGQFLGTLEEMRVHIDPEKERPVSVQFDILLSSFYRKLACWSDSLEVIERAYKHSEGEEGPLRWSVLYNYAAILMDKPDPDSSKAKQLISELIDAIKSTGEDDPKQYVVRASIRLSNLFVSEEQLDESEALLNRIKSNKKMLNTRVHLHYCIALVKLLKAQAQAAKLKAIEIAEKLGADDDLKRAQAL